MNTAPAGRAYTIPFAMACTLVLVAEWIVVRSWAFQQEPDLFAIAVTFDIVTILPLLFYFLILRPKKLSPLFVVPCFLICNLLAARILPSSQQAYLYSLQRLLPVLELGLVVFVASKVPGLLRIYRAERPGALYFTDAFLATLRKALGRNPLFVIVAVESLLVLYAFAGWFLRWKGSRGVSFTYYRKGGYTAVLGILLFVALIETVALHLIVSRWSAGIAWVLTALSLYGLLWIIGDFHAIRLHPILVTEDTLHLRTGLRWRADIPLGRVADVRIGGPQNSRAKSYLRASVLWPRAVIHLSEPATVEGLFGMQKTVTEIGVSVDEPELLRRALVVQNVENS